MYAIRHDDNRRLRGGDRPVFNCGGVSVEQLAGQAVRPFGIK
jgi:hypothetical protein